MCTITTFCGGESGGSGVVVGTNNVVFGMAGLGIFHIECPVFGPHAIWLFHCPDGLFQWVWCCAVCGAVWGG